MFLGSPWFFVIFNGGYEATPLWAARVPLLVGGSVPHQGGRQTLSFLLTWGTYQFHSPLFGLANHDPVQWVVTFILGFTICQCQWALTLFCLPYVHVPSKVCSHMTLPKVFSHMTLPKVFSHLSWTLQWTSMAEVITSHLSTSGKLCW